MGHETINFVDDSTNLIFTKNIVEMEKYLNNFYVLLESVYNINKLSINKTKTEFMFVCKDRFRKSTKNIKLNAGGHEVKQVSIVKILGFKIQHNLQNSSQINGLISNSNNRLFNIKNGEQDNN